MKVKGILFCCFLFTIVCCSSFKNIKTENTNSPNWLKKQEVLNAYPKEKFLSSVGVGKTPEIAKDNADAELSSYFSVSIKSNSSLEENFSVINDEITNQKEFARAIFVSSETKLFALEHSAVYFDRDSQNYAVCAYINREEALKFVELKIQEKSDYINFFFQKAKLENENFYKIIFFNKVVNESQDFYNLYYFLLGINSEKAKKYFFIKEEINESTKKVLELKQNSKIFIKADVDAEKRIKTKFAEIFSKSGFSVVTSSENSINGKIDFYIANISVNSEIFENNGIYTSYPSLKIYIEKTDSFFYEKTLTSFERQFGKISSYEREMCKRMIFQKIENELENNFIKEVLNDSR